MPLILRHGVLLYHMTLRDKLEIWGKEQRESARRPKYDLGN